LLGSISVENKRQALHQGGHGLSRLNRRVRKPHQNVPCQGRPA